MKTVFKSRRWTDFAVMFDERSWTDGFKMVVFGPSVELLGGETWLRALEGRRLRVRGLLVKHYRYGYQIVVNDPAMILDVT